jgi:hypothetical protein
MFQIVIVRFKIATAKPYGVFQELDKEKKYFNFDEIRTQIEA